jgi:hypothetical protein
MRTYFFGVRSAHDKGHFLYLMDARQHASREDERLPFKFHILDGALLPQNTCQPQGECHLAYIGGWTILSMWDRTADARGNSNASFLFEGQFTMEEAKELAAKHHPTMWKRIQQL